MGNQYNKIYWIKNFSTNEIETFSENEKDEIQKYLKEKNENGFNIYLSVNTFFWNNRIIEDIAEIKACFIDLDFPEIKDFWYDEEWIKRRANFLKNTYYNLIQPKLNIVKEQYNIFPNKINVTYKWLHIFYYYDDDCWFINTEIHNAINDILNNIVWWDKSARDLARLCKLEWFIDWKNWRKWEIKTIYQNEKNKISKEIITNKFNLTFKNRSLNEIKIKKEKALNKLISNIKKDDTKNSNIFKINKIDSLIFTKKLREYFENKKEKFSQNDLTKILNKLKYEQIQSIKWKLAYKFYEEDWKTLTSGLFLVQNDIWYEIQDFSKRNRSNNYSFLQKWILENIKLDYKIFNEIIYFTTGLTLNTKDEKKSIIDKKVFLDFLNSRLILEWQNYFHSESKIIDNFNYPEWFSKIFLGVFLFLYKHIEFDNLDENNPYYFYFVNDIFKEIFNITTKSWLEHNKKLFFEIIEIISEIKIDLNWKEVKVFEKIEKSKSSNKDVIKIFPNKNNLKFRFSNEITFFNIDILSFQKWFKKNKITEFLILVNWFTQVSKFDVNYKLKDVYNFLGYNGNEKTNESLLLKHLKKAKKLWIINFFEVKNSNIYFSKFKK